MHHHPITVKVAEKKPASAAIIIIMTIRVLCRSSVFAEQTQGFRGVMVAGKFATWAKTTGGTLKRFSAWF